MGHRDCYDDPWCEYGNGHHNMENKNGFWRSASKSLVTRTVLRPPVFASSFRFPRDVGELVRRRPTSCPYRSGGTYVGNGRRDGVVAVPGGSHPVSCHYISRFMTSETETHMLSRTQPRSPTLVAYRPPGDSNWVPPHSGPADCLVSVLHTVVRRTPTTDRRSCLSVLLLPGARSRMKTDCAAQPSQFLLLYIPSPRFSVLS